MKPVKLLSGRQCNRKSVKSPSACIYFNRRCAHAGTGLAGWTVAGSPGVTSIVDRTANRQAAVDGDRSSDRRSDSIRRLTPAVVRASIMGFGFPFFRRRQQRYALDGEGGRAGNRLLLERSAGRSEFTHITSLTFIPCSPRITRR